MSDEQPVTLADAYALVTPQDSRQLYARWAATYESDFVALNQYVIPDRVAEVFADAAGRGGRTCRRTSARRRLRDRARRRGAGA